MFRLIFALSFIFLADCLSCPDDYSLIDNRCFKFFPNVYVPWEEAREMCLDEGGDLAIINDCSLFGLLVKFIQYDGHETNKLSKGYWIGGKDLDTAGSWYWVDLTTPMELGVPYWGTDEDGVFQPANDENENCAMLVPETYYFHSKNCTVNGSPLCQTSPKEEETIKH